MADLGYQALLIALALSLYAVIIYTGAARKSAALYLESAHRAVVATLLLVTLASAALIYAFLTRDFQLQYVAQYSNRSLSWFYTLAAFWAGQDGSLLFWTWLLAIFGVIVLYTNKKRHPELLPAAMAVIQFTTLFFLYLATFKTNPFAKLPFMPEDGNGLNPLLQNPGMVFHPPSLYVGFVAFTVPFAFAIAALINKSLDERWIKSIRRWTLFAWLFLTIGNILGMQWAYVVLGWGGWWGWDPVENSSLIPWMVSLILIHTLSIQKSTGRLTRTNFILAVLLYLLIIYSTFLTRSGILAEVSVHSFITSGSLTYLLLIMWMALIAACAAGILFASFQKHVLQTDSDSFINRVTLLSAAMIVLGICAAIILFGTSWPLFSNSAVEPDFYNRTTLPFAIIMMLLLGLSLRTEWNQTDRRSFFKNLVTPAVIAVLISAFLVLYGLKDISAVVLTTASIFAFFISAETGIRMLKANSNFIGSTIAHAGLAVLFVGIIISGRYGQTLSASLTIDQQKEIFGYQLTYRGTSFTDDGKTRFFVEAARNGSYRMLEPAMFESNYNSEMMRNPDCISYWDEDLYIEPVSVKRKKIDSCLVVDLVKGTAAVCGSMTVKFEKFDFSSYDKNEMIKGSDAEITIGVVLEVNTEKGSQIVIPVTKFSSGGEKEMKTAYLKNSGIGFRLSAIDIGTGSGEKTRIEINITGISGSSADGPNPETLIAEVSVKPFISLIWISALFIISGMLITAARHLKYDKV